MGVNLRMQHENTMRCDKSLVTNLVNRTEVPYEVNQKKRCISTSLETKSDRQSSTHAGVQEILSTKLREETQQLRMNHDSKHHEIDTPRRAMEPVLELDEANEIIRWNSRPCEGRPEGSGRTQEQPDLLVSIPNRRRIQGRRRTKSVCRRLCEL